MTVGIYIKENSDKKTLREHCQVMGWEHKIYSDLKTLLDDVHSGKIGIVMVKSIDKFSMESSVKISPFLIWKNLNDVVRMCGCRFISVEEKIDSNKLMWESSVVVAIANNPRIQKKDIPKRGRPMITNVKNMSRTTKWRRKKLGLI